MCHRLVAHFDGPVARCYLNPAMRPRSPDAPIPVYRMPTRPYAMHRLREREQHAEAMRVQAAEDAARALGLGEPPDTTQ